MDFRSLGRRLLVGLVFAGGVGCAEHQFLLDVRNPDAVEVTGSTEPVSRLPEPGPTPTPPGPGKVPATGQPFSDRGVLLRTGSEVAYWRDGDWIASVDPIRVEERGARIAVDYTLHPGRRDLPLSLSTERDNVCELRTRDRLDRALGYAGLVLGATAGVFVPITALSHDEGTRHAAPYLGAVAAALFVAGAAWVFWPAGGEHVVIPPSCRSVAAAP